MISSFAPQWGGGYLLIKWNGPLQVYLCAEEAADLVAIARRMWGMCMPYRALVVVVDIVVMDIKIAKIWRARHLSRLSEL